MRSRLTALAALLAVLTAIPISPTLAASARDITLKLSDLPAGFHQTTARSISNAQMAQKTGISKAQFDQHGRITGYETDFTTSASVGSTAYAGIGSKVYLYKTASGAHWDFNNAVRVDLSQGMTRLSAARVGQESTALTAVEKAGKVSYTIDLVYFRRGVMDMSVVVIAPTGHMGIKDALRYARLMDARASH